MDPGCCGFMAFFFKEGKTTSEAPPMVSKGEKGGKTGKTAKEDKSKNGGRTKVEKAARTTVDGQMDEKEHVQAIRKRQTVRRALRRGAGRGGLGRPDIPDEMALKSKFSYG